MSYLLGMVIGALSVLMGITIRSLWVLIPLLIIFGIIGSMANRSIS